MIKLKADVHGNQHDVRIMRTENTVVAEIDGRPYKVEVHNSGKGEYLIRRGVQVYSCRVEIGGNQPGLFKVHTRGTDFAVALVDPRRLRSAQTAGQHDHGSARIVALMPGKVVRLLVEVGAQVEAGAGIVVVEAMKMQNEMKSPKAGVVTSLHAAPGSTVNAGDVLAEIE